MTESPAPDAVQIVRRVIDDSAVGPDMTARAVVAALAAAGLLVDRERLAALEAENRQLRYRLDEMDIRAGEVLDSPVVDGRTSVRPEHVEALRATMQQPLDQEVEYDPTRDLAWTRRLLAATQDEAARLRRELAEADKLLLGRLAALEAVMRDLVASANLVPDSAAAIVDRAPIDRMIALLDAVPTVPPMPDGMAAQAAAHPNGEGLPGAGVADDLPTPETTSGGEA